MALRFFIDLYSSKDNSQEEIDEFFSTLLTDLKKYYQEKSQKMVGGVLKLLEVVINDSEKKVDIGI